MSLNGTEIENWQAAEYAILVRPDAQLRLGLRRDGRPFEVEVKNGSVLDPQMKAKVGRLGVAPMVGLRRIDPGSPAALAGLRDGDGILAVDGESVRTFPEFARRVGASEGKPLQLRVLRGDSRLDITVAAARVDGTWRLGVQGTVVFTRLPLPGAVRAAVLKSWELTKVTVDTLGRLVTFQLSPKSLSGPLGIAKASGEAAQEGLDRWFTLVAFISLQVGILNLLPIAPLDGGHLAILSLESVRRRDLSERAKVWVMNAGLVVLLGLVVVVFYSDLSKLPVLERYLP